MRSVNIILLFVLILSVVAAMPIGTRQRRQIDLTVSAEHDDKDDETELALEAIAGLWSSADSRTKIDGSARVVHRTSGMQTGSEQDWRLGVRVVFS
ncbi:uncharacterized protein LOC6557220 isoform X1 [Drosophila grimshawi]|uniref:uncharacterized protein LOC6557220 isoform X1 n=1 Tax=Drosophila grimshawi TaxID=7222 RepID=UPI000C86FFB7|nr:uncharacterized protein LOC6557220 isoform X1 [Drosophila grimshawi]